MLPPRLTILSLPLMHRSAPHESSPSWGWHSELLSMGSWETLLGIEDLPTDGGRGLTGATALSSRAPVPGHRTPPVSFQASSWERCSPPPTLVLWSWHQPLVRVPVCGLRCGMELQVPPPHPDPVGCGDQLPEMFHCGAYKPAFTASHAFFSSAVFPGRLQGSDVERQLEFVTGG